MAIRAQGIKEILNQLNPNEILKLTSTVTNGLIKNKIQTKEEGINTIITYSTDELSILRRKIITREILFNYVHDRNIAITLPCTKDDLIETILKYWNVELQTVENNREVDEDRSEIKDVKQENYVKELVLKFVEWFFEQMNEKVPLNPTHFWSDAKLKLNLISSNSIDSKEVDSSTGDIVELLFKVKRENNIYFLPNTLEEGTKGWMNPHGLVVVATCGTLHTENECVGAFEQMFYLARDPFSENNWKIKKTELSLKKAAYNVLPNLENVNLLQLS